MEEAESRQAGRKAIIAVVIVVIIVVASVGVYLILSEEPEDSYEGIIWKVVNETLPSIIQDNISSGPVFIDIHMDHAHSPSPVFELVDNETYEGLITVIPIFPMGSSTAYYQINSTDMGSFTLDTWEWEFLWEWCHWFGAFARTYDHANDTTTYYGLDYGLSEYYRATPYVDCALGIFNGTVEPRLAPG